MLIYACNRQSARYEQSTSPLPFFPNPLQQASTACPPLHLYGDETFWRDKLCSTAQREQENWVSAEVGSGGRAEGAEVCEKLVSEVNKSICHNQFRCKIPSLLGQISLFLFLREGDRKKKQVERWRKFLQFDYEICLRASYENNVASGKRKR